MKQVPIEKVCTKLCSGSIHPTFQLAIFGYTATEIKALIEDLQIPLQFQLWQYFEEIWYKVRCLRNCVSEYHSIFSHSLSVYHSN